MRIRALGGSSTLVLMKSFSTPFYSNRRSPLFVDFDSFVEVVLPLFALEFLLTYALLLPATALWVLLVVFLEIAEVFEVPDRFEYMETSTRLAEVIVFLSCCVSFACYCSFSRMLTW